MSPDHIFRLLQGEWSFTRDVPGQASMKGTARIEALSPEVAQYDERAELQLADGQTIRGERRYLYCATEAGFDVLFDDTGRLFHSLRFAREEDGALGAEARHECSPDVYLSSYSVWSEDRFEVRHVVSGPRKDYAIHTIYTRAEATV